jgi:TPR repeat protein
MYLVSKNYKEAIKNFSKAIKLDGNMAIAYLHRGQTKVETRKVKPSCKDFTVASELGNAEAKELLNLHCPIEEEEKEEPVEEKEEKK